MHHHFDVVSSQVLMSMASLGNTVPVGGHDSEFVECRQCGENLQHSLISEHESEQCSKRPFSCEYCKQYKSTFEDVSTNHWPKCNNYPVPCPEHCETTAIQRQNLEHHINEECPLTTVKCSFSHAGCEVQLHRRDLSSHLAENIGTHLDLLGSQNRKLQQEAADKDARITRLATELQKVQNHLDEEIGAQNQRLAQETTDKNAHIERMTKVNKELKGNVDQLSMHQNASKREIDQLRRAQKNSMWAFIIVTALMAVLMAVVISFQGHFTSLQGQYHYIESNITSLQGQHRHIVTTLQGHYLLQLPPYFITMCDFQWHKENDNYWYSPPFYTHPKGYKMGLRVDANGSGNGTGTHVSVYAHLMQGEFDGDLKWPFRSHVVIQLCNQLQDKYHHGITIDFSETTDARVVSRVTTGDIAESGWGLQTLILHNDLDFNPTTNCQYLKNDCLHFRIVAVESLSEPGVLPTELTMTNFEQHKIDRDSWFSPPFYTHPQGYKMGLRVDANGSGNGTGTHVSVYAHLMQGEFDDHLKWPFRGHVVIQLCNQLQDKYHHGFIVDFSGTTDARFISRVTTGDIAEGGLGHPTLILHNNLNFNPTTNCQYLKNDCLQFRIVAVESLSEPGVLPTELTMTNFEQHKIDRDSWVSPPFYTHPKGYKMCLFVNANGNGNGNGNGKGTHVSVYAYLMQGEFDDDLKWPFQGHVTVAVLNQLEDNNHTTETIHFTSTLAIAAEVNGWLGYILGHTELNYNPTKNRQYLVYDCLRFRIVKVELK